MSSDAIKVTVSFRHGLGDTTYFAHQLPLYRRRGFHIEVLCNPDKRVLFEPCGVGISHRSGEEGKVAWNHPPKPEAGRSLPIWMENKAAFNLGRSPIPALPDVSPEVLWEEFCAERLDVMAHIPREAQQDADQFLASLPQPVILLHTIGNSFQRDKSLSPEVTRELYATLLQETDGTLVLLDWDNRVPKLAHYRVRHLTDDWHRIDVPRLLALLAGSDLLIGIDSGPFHAARFTDTPALAVFPFTHHWPSRYVLPRARQAILVPRSARDHPNRRYRAELNLIESDGQEVGGAFIAEQAIRMLAAPRYLPPPMRGADLQFQRFVCDWEEGRPGALSEVVDRNRSFDLLLREIVGRFHTPRIVETGCIRAEEDWGGAGYSTYLFALFVHRFGGRLTSVDNDAAHCAFASEQTSGFRNVEIVHADSVAFLSALDTPIDLLFLDSVDTTQPGCAEHTLAEAEAACRHLHPRSIVAVDDTVYRAREFHGKGRLAVPWFLERGWSILYSGYQTLLHRQ